MLILKIDKRRDEPGTPKEREQPIHQHSASTKQANAFSGRRLSHERRRRVNDPPRLLLGWNYTLL